MTSEVSESIWEKEMRKKHHTRFDSGEESGDDNCYDKHIRLQVSDLYLGSNTGFGVSDRASEGLTSWCLCPLTSCAT